MRHNAWITAAEEEKISEIAALVHEADEEAQIHVAVPFIRNGKAGTPDVRVFVTDGDRMILDNVFIGGIERGLEWAKEFNEEKSS